MDIRFVLGLSILFQLGAAAIALWLIRVTGRRVAWVLLAAGIALMAVRRAITLYHSFSGEPAHSLDLTAELVALVTSIAMLVGLALIVPLFRSVQRSLHDTLEGETRFRQLVEAAFDGICVHDGERMLDANAAFATMFGYTESELVGMPPLDLIASDSRETVAEVIASGSDAPYEVDAIRKNGTVFRVEICGKPIGYRGQEARVATVRDITERKCVEERLRLLSLAVEQSTEGLAVTDVDGHLLFVNEAFAAMHGYVPDELVRKHLSVFHNAEQLPAVEEANRQIFDTGAFHGEVWHARRDGTVFLASMHNSLVKDNMGCSVGIIGTLRDITDSKEQEQELLETRHRLDHLLASSPSVIFTCGLGPEYPTTFIGGNVSSRLGYEPAEFYEDASFWSKQIHPDDAERVHREFSRIEKEEHVSYEYRFRHKAGHYIWLHDELVPLKDKDGTIYGVVGSWFDVTDRKRMEEELQRAHDELEQRVAERTAELMEANQRLRREVAERERVEAALRESTRKFRAIFDQTFEFIGLMTPDGTLIEANRSALSFAGIEESDVLGKPFWDTPWWAHSAELQDRLQDATGRAAAGEFVRFEANHPAADGRVLHVDFSLKPWRDEAGNVIFLIPEGRDITERMRVEEKLRGSEEKFRSLLETTSDWVWEVDQDGRYTYASPRIRDLLGFEPEEVIGKTPFDLMPSNEARRVAEWYGEKVKTGEPFSGLQNTNLHKSGRLVVIETNAVPVLDKAGNLMGYRGIDRDITKRKRVEEELRKSEEHLRTVVGASKDAILAIGEDGLVTLFNPAAERMFGWSADEMLGGPLDRLLPEDNRADHQEYVDGYFRHGEPARAVGQTLELRAVRKDGHEFPIGLSLSTGSLGAQRFALAVIRDITDAKQAEEALMTRLRYEEGLAACSRALLGHGGTEEALKEALQHLLRASGVSRVYVFENFEDREDGLCMRQIQEVCSPGVKPQIDDPLLRHLPYAQGFARWEEKLGKGEAVGGVVKSLTEGEREVLEPQDVLSILALPVFLEGEWSGFVGFDDTRLPRTWTEEDARLLQTAAEIIGAFMTRERAEERLRHALEDAEAASRAKSVFLANMSHEIRTPITAMLAATELLADQMDDYTEPPVHLDMISANGRHLLALIDDLLDLSRTEAGKLEVRRAPCFLLDVVSDVQAVTELLHQREAVDFRILFETPIPTEIYTDPTRLKQAIINLISNALKFTEVGYVRVRVAVHRDLPEPSLHIAVEDSGVGIPGEEIENIFQTFAQIEPGPSGIFGGVGLGLPLAKWIAEQLGGSVDVTSHEGRGSTFTLRVAANPPENTEWFTPEDLTIPVRPRLRTGGSRRKGVLSGYILLAEDFPDTRRLIEEALNGCGATVVAVGNGEDAVKAALGRSFDLILMDIRMPGMDGLAATAELRRQGCMTPIVALTASTSGRDREQILKAGFDDFWKKPIPLDLLVESVATYIGTEQAKPTMSARDESASCISEATQKRLAVVRAEFVGNLPQRLARITSAVETRDMLEAREALHQLFGAGGIHGFMSISEEAARLLELARNETLAGCPHELSKLEELIEDAARTIREMGDD